MTEERKPVLEAIRDELGKRGLVSILFDFEQPQSRSPTATVTTLANLARFVIADLTDATSVLHELQAIVPTRLSLPVKSIILASQCEPAMLESLLQYPGF